MLGASTSVHCCIFRLHRADALFCRRGKLPSNSFFYIPSIAHPFSASPSLSLTSHLLLFLGRDTFLVRWKQANIFTPPFRSSTQRAHTYQDMVALLWRIKHIAVPPLCLLYASLFFRLPCDTAFVWRRKKKKSHITLLQKPTNSEPLISSQPSQPPLLNFHMSDIFTSSSSLAN